MHDASWVQVSWVEVSGVQVSWVQVSWVPDLRFSPRLCTKMSRVQVSWVRGQPNWEDSSSETPKMDRQKGAGAADLGGLLERNTQNGSPEGCGGSRTGRTPRAKHPKSGRSKSTRNPRVGTQIGY